MKKIYLLAATALFALSANAQFTDGFESYDDGPIFTDLWTTWSGTEGGAEDGEISLDYSNGGEKSLKLTGGGSQDVIYY